MSATVSYTPGGPKSITMGFGVGAAVGVYKKENQQSPIPATNTENREDDLGPGQPGGSSWIQQ